MCLPWRRIPCHDELRASSSMAFCRNRIVKWIGGKKPAAAIVGTALIATSVWAQSGVTPSAPAQTPSSEAPATPATGPGDKVPGVATHLTNDVQAPTLVPVLNAVIAKAPAKPKILPPPGPPVPVRGPAAILRVLDKVTEMYQFPCTTTI